VNRRRLVRVPASSANLGPGYDVLAAAVSIHRELEVEEGGGFSVETNVPGVSADRDNLCVQAFEMLHSADDISFRIRSEIPLAAGLGSSAAAIVAGLAAADHMYELDADLYPLATELEGHPDNVAAALHGGFVVCTRDGVERLEPIAELEGIVAIPPDRVLTTEASGALPVEVPLGDAVFNVARAALLMVGLSRSDLDLVGRGLADHIHQPRREHLYPRSMELVRSARELGAVGATISGAGPSVLFWTHFEQTGQLMERLRKAAADCELRRVTFAPEGANVRAL
jgi:homoserine kinase